MTSLSITTVEKFIETFPIPTLTRIVGQPTYEQVKELNEELNANAASIVTTRGGGAHGYLAITVSPTIYATLTSTAFVAPTMPPPVDPAGMTGPQIANANRIFNEQKTEFHSYINLQNALKKQLIAAVDPLFLRTIRQPYVGFANCTIRDMLRHLYETHADISADDLDENDRKMREPWDPNGPFEGLIKQIKDSVDLADHAGVPYSQEQIVNTAYTLVDRAGVLDFDCRKWRDLPAEDRTWPEFQRFFKKAHKDWEKHSKRPGTQGRYGQACVAPAVHPHYEDTTITALANFASSTATDRAALSKLTDTVQELTAELKAARAKIDLLQAKLHKYEENRERNRENREPTILHYCFTHGFCCAHSSSKCPDKSDGHQNGATAKNTMGGSTAKLDEFLKAMAQRHVSRRYRK